MSSLPSSPAAISAEWLTRALGSRFPGVVVERVVVEAFHVGTNSNAQLRPVYATSAGAPTSIFAKLPPQRELQRELVYRSGMARREVDFYRRLASLVPMRVPDAYFADYDPEDGSFVILLEDLRASGCGFPDGIEGVSLEYATRAIDDFAALHALSVGRRDDPRFAWVEPLMRMRDYGAGMLQHGLDTRSERLAPAFADVARLYIDYTDRIHDLWEQGVCAVVQGDGHATNLFEDAGRPGFLDWGCFAFAPAIRDVSYFLCMSLPTRLRRTHERALLERYLTAMEKTGTPVASPDEAWELHRLHAAYTVPGAAPAVLSHDGMPEDQQAYAATFLARATAAVEDLEVPAALRSALGL